MSDLANVRVHLATEPMSDEARRDIEAGRATLAAFGTTAAQAAENLERGMRAMTCAFLGHDWPDGACRRCGFDPMNDLPRLWEGDQA